MYFKTFLFFLKKELLLFSAVACQFKLLNVRGRDSKAGAATFKVDPGGVERVTGHPPF